MMTAFRVARALLASGVIQDAVVLVEDGHVLRCGAAARIEVPVNASARDFGDALLAPSYFDVHVHGSAGHDVMEDSPDGQRRMAEFLARHGVGRFLPTTVTAPVEETLRALERLAEWMEACQGEDAPGARPVGVHLEGPFISHAKRGVQPEEHIQPPSIELFDRFWQAARGRIKLMTIAPELPGALDLIRHAASKGVRVSLGHSDATAAQAREGIAAGAVSATHCFNAMRGFEHREPGLLGAVLDSRELFAELICDGHHVSDEAVRLFARAKPADRRILITDAISAAGQGDGEFRLGGLRVQVQDNRATLDGKLAGSVLTLDRGVANFVRITRTPLEQAALAASFNPAAMLGMSAGLEPGARADFVVLGGDGGLLGAVLGGEVRN